jgi:hypothetical protein
MLQAVPVWCRPAAEMLVKLIGPEKKQRTSQRPAKSIKKLQMLQIVQVGSTVKNALAQYENEIARMKLTLRIVACWM